MDGICTLGNDRVYDQLVALLNSIEQRYGQDMPVCIYPYDQQIDRVATLVQQRPQVQLYQDAASIAQWDQFVRQVWDAHPTARQRWGVNDPNDPNYYHRVGTHRRFCAFDGPFDRFLYLDADTLLLDAVDYIFAALDDYDWVVYDYQYKDLTHVYESNAAQLTQIFSPERLAREIFCSGFYAAKSGLFSQEVRATLLATLQAGEAEILYPMAPDQTILNYMVMKGNLAAMNLSQTLPVDRRTGNSVTSEHFEQRGDRLFDRGKPLTYLHYIGLSSSLFRRVSTGENLDFPYRDLFLHYRFLKEPGPTFSGQPTPYNAPPRLSDRLMQKLGALRAH